MANGDLTLFTITAESRHPWNKSFAYDEVTHTYNQDYVNASRGWWVLCDARGALTPNPVFLRSPNVDVPGVRNPFQLVDISEAGFVEDPRERQPQPPIEVPDNVVSYEWSYRLDSDQNVSETVTKRRSDSPYSTNPSLMAWHAFNVRSQATYSFRIEIALNDGNVLAREQQFRIRDRLVVSIGDSYASGEGNPDTSGRTANLSNFADQVLDMLSNVPGLGLLFDFLNLFNSGDEFCEQATFVQFVRAILAAVKESSDSPLGEIATSPTTADELIGLLGAIFEWSSHETTGVGAEWQEPLAHRSYLSGPSRAAQLLESPAMGDVVTFLSFARSGSKIVKGTIGPRDEDLGWKPIGQFDEIRQAVQDREIDALLISVGGNDVGFASRLADLVKRDAIFYGLGDDDANRQRVDDAISIRLDSLPDLYDQLNTSIQGLDIEPDRVFITEYPESFFDDPRASAGVSRGCGVFSGPDLDIDLQDALLIKEKAGGLNDQIRAAAERYGWNFIGGIADGFDGHGYCSGQSFFRFAEDSCRRQGDFDGTMHPNFEGHGVYAASIAARLRPALFRVTPQDPSGQEPAPPVGRIAGGTSSGRPDVVGSISDELARG